MDNLLEWGGIPVASTTNSGSCASTVMAVLDVLESNPGDHELAEGTCGHALCCLGAAV